MSDIEKLIENKKVSDRKQRRINLFIILLSLTIVAIIFVLTTDTAEQNILLNAKIDSTKAKEVSLKKILYDTLNFISTKLKIETIECQGIPTGYKTTRNLPLYDFTMKIVDSSIISSLYKVEYFFNDDSYNPKLKISNDSLNGFGIKITNSWGCMSVVPVYLYYKNNIIDTILFPMCDQAKIKLPEL